MWVRELHLVDFRSYAAADLELESGNTVVIGANGQGKTNIVEAVGYVATLDSHRVHGDASLVRMGAERGVIRLVAAIADRDVTIELELNPGRANRVRINGSPANRVRDVLGVFRCVTFAPEDLRLVKGDPADRRRFLDGLMVQAAPRYAGVRSDFERVLKQRNALLRSSVTVRGPELADTLAAWDDRYVPLAAELTWGRLNAVRQLSGPVSEAYLAISPTADSAGVAYDSALTGVGAAGSREELAELIGEGLRRQQGEELRRGVTLLGPHRDDLAITLNEQVARSYASHGESWSLALSLRLAAFGILTELTGDPPVLVLDDVFAELDTVRRARLALAVSGAQQVIVTAAVPADVPGEFGGGRFRVTKDGTSTVSADRPILNP